MGIYIPKEPMPKFCARCPLCKIAKLQKMNEMMGFVFSCALGVDLSKATRAALYEKRAKGCPLVEVPEPHGRLIDADNGIDEDVKDYEFNGKYAGCTIQDMLDCAPTVIEEE